VAERRMTVAEAQALLPQLWDELQVGDRVVIEQAGKPGALVLARQDGATSPPRQADTEGACLLAELQKAFEETPGLAEQAEEFHEMMLGIVRQRHEDVPRAVEL